MRESRRRYLIYLFPRLRRDFPEPEFLAKFVRLPLSMSALFSKANNPQSEDDDEYVTLDELLPQHFLALR